MIMRKVINIDELLCNGRGECIIACAPGPLISRVPTCWWPGTATLLPISSFRKIFIRGRVALVSCPKLEYSTLCRKAGRDSQGQ